MPPVPRSTRILRTPSISHVNLRASQTARNRGGRRLQLIGSGLGELAAVHLALQLVREAPQMSTCGHVIIGILIRCCISRTSPELPSKFLGWPC